MGLGLYNLLCYFRVISRFGILDFGLITCLDFVVLDFRVCFCILDI